MWPRWQWLATVEIPRFARDDIGFVRSISAESGVHHVVQHRPERVADSGEHEKLVVRRELPLLRENLFRAGAHRGEIQLIRESLRIRHQC